MKKLSIFVLKVLFMVTWVSTATAQQNPFSGSVSNVGTTAAAFLNIGVGSRAAAMGSAFTASADDASAVYWNPAGMGQCQRPELTFDHTNWFLDIYHEFVGAVVPSGRHRFGAGVAYLGVPDQPVRTIEAPEGTGDFYNASDLMLMLSYACQFTDQFTLGLSGKYVRQQIYHSTGAAAAMDLGAFYQPSRLRWLRMGIQIANFGSDLRLRGQDLDQKVDIDPDHHSHTRLPASLDTDAFSLPLIFRFGLAATPMQNRRHRLVTAVDLIHPSNNTESLNLGLEYVLLGTYALRTGFQSLLERDSDTTGGFTFGLGVKVYLQGVLLILDYAYRDFGVLPDVSRFSCGVRF